MADQPGHEGHNHPPGVPPVFDQELFDRLMKDVDEAKIINNLFLIPVNTHSQPRFVMAQVDAEGDIHTLGYIPFDFMLDVGIGFIQAVRNAVRLGIPTEEEIAATAESEGEENLAGGVYRVI